MEILTSIYALLSGGQGVNPKIDSVAFRLHCGATTAALLAASAALTTRHLVGNPIDCIHTRDIPEDVLNTYCWIHSTFTVAGEAGEGAYPGVRGAGTSPRRYGKYYQWVAFTLFFQTARVTIQSPKNDQPCRLLLDCGSQRSYMTSQMARKAKIIPDREDILTIFTFGSDTPNKTLSPSAEIDMVTKRGIKRTVRVNIVPHITEKVPIINVNNLDIVDIPADDDSIGERIDLLIGNDYYFSFIRSENIRINETLYLVNTDFGWIVSGNMLLNDDGIPLSVVTYCQCHDAGCPYFTEPDLPLRAIDMKFLWSLESIGITDSPKATREEEAVKYFNDTVDYVEGRYQVKWPWIEFPPQLPSNYSLAYGRLKSLLRNLDNSTLTDYEEILKEQLNAQVIEIVDARPAKTDTPIHYLPHHIIKQKGKRGRIVYDASAKIKDHKSLNECLHSGPSMLEDMTALLLRFRSGKIGITADVEKAFLQVGLQKDDREVTRFLWVKDITREPTEDNLLHLRFCRVPFGVKSSPFLLTATIRYHLSKKNQLLLKEIADRCYVDNLVTNAESVDRAVELYSKTRKVFDELSMNIREWTSNSQEFMEHIQESHRAKPADQVKVLGLMWNLDDDTLQLKSIENILQDDNTTNTNSKRQILKTLARLYDPCGFVALLVLSAKLLFQEMCNRKMKWDQPLPDDLEETWMKVKENLRAGNNVKISRHAGDAKINKETKYQLHCFTDASKNAYAAVVYLRATNGDISKTSFLMSKSRITPVEDKNDLKIPRLELLGYLIGNRLLNYVKNNLGLPIDERFLWTDSLIVLNWMVTSKLLPPFVSRRVNEIKQQKDVEFCYINTNENPADLATRPELWQQKKHLWFNGPEFLSGNVSMWPNNMRILDWSNSCFAGEVLDMVDGPEMIDKGYEDCPQMQLEDEPFSAFHKSPKNPTNTDSSDSDLGNEVIKKLQAKHFAEEISGKVTHLTRNLGLFLDIDGILRCKGRMGNTNWTYDKKHPILIPRDSAYTNNIIQKTHEANYHVGVSHTLSLIRQKYWIPQGRSQVQRILKRCPQCLKHGGGPYKLPDTPALPTERVTYSTPFTFTGIDYFGPIFVNTHQGREKRWVCLYTCLAVRAIHLELVKDMTAEECLLALRRFTATRGIPQMIVSDNATQFKLTSEVLTDPYCVDNGVKWKFIPQLAPWHGGFYERLVALVKHCLKRSLDKHLLRDAQLLTVIKEVEAVVNTRPLISVGTELEHVLKPADFLTPGECLEMAPMGHETYKGGTTTKISLIESWKRGKMILEEFKRMFQEQYLPSLRERYKCSYKQQRVTSDRVPRLGDLVQIKDDSKNRISWKVGRISSLMRGSDGECRVARVLVEGNELTRSIAHLYPLEGELSDDMMVPTSESTNVDPSRVGGSTNNEIIPETDQLQGANNVEVDIEMSDPISSDQNLTKDFSDSQRPDFSDPFRTPLVDTDVPLHEDEVLREDESDNVAEVDSPQAKVKRDAAIRARAKIAEWTRHLMALL